MNQVEQAIRKRPKVQGGQPFVGQYLNQALVHAEDEAKQMGDEYVSVEHLFLAHASLPEQRDEGDFPGNGYQQGRFLAGAFYGKGQPEGNQ